MATVLILLTKKYPYDKGEEFLENEITIIAKQFNRVVVIAVAVDPAAKRTRELPDNATCYRINDIKGRIRYPIYAARGFCYIYDKELREELLPMRSARSALGIMYYYTRMRRALTKVRKIILNLSLQRDDRIVLYSFWFMDTAHIACKLRDQLSCQYQIKAVSRAHGYDLYEDRNWTGIIPYRAYVMEKIDAVFPCSRHGAEYLKLAFPQYKQKVITSYLGTEDYGTELGRPARRTRIVTCSAISPVKRLLLVAQALHALESRGVFVDWLCIGDGPLSGELRTYIATHLHHSKVTFTGNITNRAVLDIYKNNYFDLFINVSSSEGLPVSIMEAQSFGIPIMATNVGGVSEIVENNVNGELLDKDISAEQLAENIERFILLTTEKKNAYRTQSRKRWMNTFHNQKNYYEFIGHIYNLF